MGFSSMKGDIAASSRTGTTSTVYQVAGSISANNEAVRRGADKIYAIGKGYKKT